MSSVVRRVQIFSVFRDVVVLKLGKDYLDVYPSLAVDLCVARRSGEVFHMKQRSIMLQSTYW